MATPSDRPAMRDPDGSPTGKQLGKISALGGSWRDAFAGTKAEASALIGVLLDPTIAESFKMPGAEVSLMDPIWEAFPKELAWRNGELSSRWRGYDRETGELNGPEPVEPRRAREKPEMMPRYGDPTSSPLDPMSAGSDPWPFPYRDLDSDAAGWSERMMERDTRVEVSSSEKLKTFVPMLNRIPVGYYTVKDSMGISRDLRVSRPTKGSYRGGLKVQVVDGDFLDLGLVVWPGGRVSVYEKTFDIEMIMLELITHNREAARLYSKSTVRCCRCRKVLTDPRSKHYGIGPECEKYMPDYIAEIDLLDAAAREA